MLGNVLEIQILKLFPLTCCTKNCGACSVAVHMASRPDCCCAWASLASPGRVFQGTQRPLNFPIRNLICWLVGQQSDGRGGAGFSDLPCAVAGFVDLAISGSPSRQDNPLGMMVRDCLDYVTRDGKMQPDCWCILRPVPDHTNRKKPAEHAPSCL